VPHRKLLHNGEIVDAGTRDLSPGQAGLLNGWGVFSTIRVYDGVMFAWERHFRRMQTDAARLSVPFPAAAEALERDLNRLIEANGNPNTVVRVSVIRNRGGLWQGPAPARDYDVIAYTRDVTKWNPVARLDLVPHGRHAASPFAGVKYLSWSENLTLFERAHEKGFDDALLLNERGEVAECTSANIYAVEGSRVWTPPLSSGCLPGITRALLLEEVRANGIEAGERVLLPADLESAGEVFITSSTRELIPVVHVEGLRIRPAHAVRDRLQHAFAACREAYVAARRSQPLVAR
jgi:branched-chain amino acid aminotransferase